MADSKEENLFKIPLPDLRTAMNPVRGKVTRKSSTLDGMTNEAAEKEMRLFGMLQVDGQSNKPQSKINCSPTRHRQILSDDVIHRKNDVKLNVKTDLVATSPSFAWDLPSSKTNLSCDVKTRYRKALSRHGHAVDASCAKNLASSSYKGASSEILDGGSVRLSSISPTSTVSTRSSNVERRSTSSRERPSSLFRHSPTTLLPNLSRTSSYAACSPDDQHHSTPLSKKVTTSLFSSTSLQDDLSPISGKQIKITMLEEMKKIGTKYSSSSACSSYSSAADVKLNSPITSSGSSSASISSYHPPSPNEEEAAAYQSRVKSLVDALYSPELERSPLKTNIVIGQSHTLFRPIKAGFKTAKREVLLRKISPPNNKCINDDISNFMDWDCDETDL